MFASLHFPDCSHYSIFFHGVISNLFGVCFRRGFVCGGGSRAIAFGFILRHTNSTTLQCLWVCADAANCCTRRHECPAEQPTGVVLIRLLRVSVVNCPWQCLNTEETEKNATWCRGCPASDLANASGLKQRHLDRFARNEHSPALPIHFHFRDALRGVDENA